MQSPKWSETFYKIFIDLLWFGLRVLLLWLFFDTVFPEFGLTIWQLALPVVILDLVPNKDRWSE